MGARINITVSGTGAVGDPKNLANAFFQVSDQDTDLFVGWSGTFSGLTFQVQGARTAGTGPYYDIGTFTTDGVGPLASPVSVLDNTATAYQGDIRVFNFFQISVLSLASGTPNLELIFGGFFPQRGSLSTNGLLSQLIYELRYQNSIFAGWLGYPSAQLIAAPPNIIGTGPGGAFPNGA